MELARGDKGGGKLEVGKERGSSLASYSSSSVARAQVRGIFSSKLEYTCLARPVSGILAQPD